MSSQRKNTSKAERASIYEECGRAILAAYAKKIVDNILKENENYSDTFSIVFAAYMYKYKFYVMSETFNPYDFSSRLIFLKDYLCKTYGQKLLKMPPIFYTITKGIISITYNSETYEFEPQKLYNEITNEDTIRIWQIISYDKPVHLAAEIVCKSGVSYSFGFSYDGEVRGSLSSAKLKLISPDYILNTEFIKQINNPESKRVVLIHESLIGKESYSRLKSLFDSLDVTNINKNNNILTNIDILVLNPIDEIKLLGEKILKENMSKTKISDGFDVILARLLNDYMTKQQTNNTNNTNNSNKKISLFYPTYEFKIDKFQEKSCVYRLFSGRAANTLKRVSNTLKMRSRSPIGLNCSSGLELLFDDLIDCGTSFVFSTPKLCKSLKYPICLTKKHKNNNGNGNGNGNGKRMSMNMSKEEETVV